GASRRRWPVLFLHLPQAARRRLTACWPSPPAPLPLRQARGANFPLACRNGRGCRRPPATHLADELGTSTGSEVASTAGGCPAGQGDAALLILVPRPTKQRRQASIRRDPASPAIRVGLRLQHNRRAINMCAHPIDRLCIFRQRKLPAILGPETRAHESHAVKR